MILFCRDFDHRSILIRLIKILDTDDLGHLAFGIDWQADRDQTFELHFQESFNDVVISNGRDLDGDFDLSTLFFSDFKPDFFEILESFIAPD